MEEKKKIDVPQKRSEVVWLTASRTTEMINWRIFNWCFRYQLTFCLSSICATLSPVQIIRSGLGKRRADSSIACWMKAKLIVLLENHNENYLGCITHIISKFQVFDSFSGHHHDTFSYYLHLLNIQYRDGNQQDGELGIPKLLWKDGKVN